MIFVTVGTHEQQFNRLIENIDKLKKQKKINDEVIIQTGYSNYKPIYCKSYKFLTYQEMITCVSKAEIVITHGGPSSFIMPLQIGKIPIVVPRSQEFKEHVNNHQVEFVRQVYNRHGNIIPVYNIEKLEETLTTYNQKIKEIKKGSTSNNQYFNDKLENIIKSIL